MLDNYPDCDKGVVIYQVTTEICLPHKVGDGSCDQAHIYSIVVPLPLPTCTGLFPCPCPSLGKETNDIPGIRLGYFIFPVFAVVHWGNPQILVSRAGLVLTMLLVDIEQNNLSNLHGALFCRLSTNTLRTRSGVLISLEFSPPFVPHDKYQEVPLRNFIEAQSGCHRRYLSTLNPVNP